MTEPTSEEHNGEESFEELEQRLSRLEHVRQTELMREMGLYQQPLRDSDGVRALMDFELRGWTAEQRSLVSPYLLDVPHFHVREWDYAGLDTPPRELYLPCWTVAHFPEKDRCSLVYCDHGHSGWGALEQDGWCSMDAVWKRSMKEIIWRFRMLDGFAPGEQDLDDWIGPVRSLTSQENEDINGLVLCGVADPAALHGHLKRVWSHYSARAESGEWKQASYLYEILTEVLGEAPLEIRQEWEERVRGHEPKPLD